MKRNSAVVWSALKDLLIDGRPRGAIKAHAAIKESHRHCWLAGHKDAKSGGKNSFEREKQEHFVHLSSKFIFKINLTPPWCSGAGVAKVFSDERDWVGVTQRVTKLYSSPASCRRHHTEPPSAFIVNFAGVDVEAFVGQGGRVRGLVAHIYIRILEPLLCLITTGLWCKESALDSKSKKKSLPNV